MSNWQKLLDAIQYVNEYGIDVEYMGTAKQLKFSPFPFNGCAYLDSDLVELYADDPKKDADKLLATLIHEFGHIMDYRIHDGGDSEWKAWEVGVSMFPPQLIPACLAKVKKKCLNYYAEDGIY